MITHDPQRPWADASYPERRGAQDGSARRPLPTLDWERNRDEDDDEDEYIEVRGIALKTVKMWVGPAAQPVV